MTLITPTLDPMGIIIDPLLCHVNHSCDPNAYVMMDGAETSIRTLRPIKKDEEIFISYIDTSSPYTKRQNELQGRWFFTCRCTKCRKGPTPPEDKWAIVSAALPEKFKQMADVVIEEKKPILSFDSPYYVGDSQNDMRVAALQHQIFESYEIQQANPDAAEAVREITKCMYLCLQTKLWPIYRQPYAALRDEIIVHLLQVQDFETAWYHCTKRYRYIFPKLYPQKAHPVRVVQTWQMAMLALYHGTEGTIKDADMDLIAFMLVGEVEQSCSASHGEESSFAKSVRQRLNEIKNEIYSKLGTNASKIIAEQIPRQRQRLNEMGDKMEF